MGVWEYVAWVYENVVWASNLILVPMHGNMWYWLVENNSSANPDKETKLDWLPMYTLISMTTKLDSLDCSPVQETMISPHTHTKYNSMSGESQVTPLWSNEKT